MSDRAPSDCLLRSWMLRNIHEQKAEAIRAQEQHLRLAAGERELYRKCCKQSKENIRQYLQETDFNFGRAPCSYNGTIHFLYDYAQE